MALIYRAHFAFIKNPIINSKGINTSAIYGFLNTLLEVIKKENPSHIGVAFDTKAPTFRSKMFKEYKANRQKQPEDIQIAIPYIKKIIKSFNIPILEKDGFEADDIIGTFANIFSKEKETQIFMMTPDKDFAQLVSSNVFLYKPAFMGRGVDILGEKEVLNKFKINRVDQVIDFLGLQGDSVDNIPGIPGVGPKTAQVLLAKYDSVEGIIKNKEEIIRNLKGVPNEQIGLFKIFESSSNEIVMGEDDKHLNFRVSLLLDSSSSHQELKNITITTTVQFNNTFGKLYFLPVKPFHHQIVPSILKGIIKELKLKNCK